MKYLTLETFTDFVCSGSDCPFTCCRDWRITIDEETDRFYQTVEGEMGEQLKKCVHRENGKAWFVLREDNHCPFLNEKGLCSIYINLGEEHLGNTCAYYPRYMFYKGDICFAGVSISCPEVAEFFLTHEQTLLIDFAETDDNTNVDENTDWELFNRAIRGFTTMVSIAQNRNYTIKERIALTVLFASGFQACIDEVRDPSDFIGLYSNTENYDIILEQIGVRMCDLSSKVSFTRGIISVFSNIKSLDTKIPEIAEMIVYFSEPGHSSVNSPIWENAFVQSLSQGNEIWQENVLVYVLFRYFMQGFSDRRFYENLMKGMETILVLSIFTIALYSIMHGRAPKREYIIMLVTRLSRIIEHNESVGEEICGYFNKAGYTDPGFVLRLIS